MLKAHVDAGLVTATTDYDELRRRRRDPRRAADTALGAARARPDDPARRDPRDRDSRCSRASWSCSSRPRTPARRESGSRRCSRRSGLKAGEDFHLAFSPERVDPGREDWTTKTTPKVVGGLTPECTRRAVEALRERRGRGGRGLLTRGRGADEAAREHLPLGQHRARQRARAALRADGLDIWEVVDAASTKPFGFMRFEPGPGLGGHCIPSTPSTSPGRRASSTSTRSSSSSRARSTRTCRTSAAR